MAKSTRTKSPKVQSSKVQSSKVQSSRLHRVDWLDAGLAALGTHGLAGVRIRSLCQDLAVTTGSFYHHFEGRADFLAALTDYWCESQVDAVIALVDAEEASPVDRALKLEHIANELGIGPQDREMRAWARHDPKVRAAVRKADRKIMELLEGLLGDAGIAIDEVGVLARVLFFTAIGSFTAEHLVRPYRRSEITESVLALVASRATKRAPRGSGAARSQRD